MRRKVDFTMEKKRVNCWWHTAERKSRTTGKAMLSTQFRPRQ